MNEQTVHGGFSGVAVLPVPAHCWCELLLLLWLHLIPQLITDEDCLVFSL